MASPESSEGSHSDDSDGEDLRARKRVKLTPQPGEEGFESDGNVLPDSYRRSPRTAQNEFQPGSIVRVTLTNFVTYTNAEFWPGPNLNMVIGPNGTGKSTLVCAICLGLGWGTGHLGRAKNISEFIKHGCKTAKIEIELARDPTRQEHNPVITTRISSSSTSSGSKTDFFIDLKESNKMAVQRLAKSYAIQVDNLCQFLPQDRVVEFASLSPVALLAATQRAAASEEVCQWHEELKTRGKVLESKQSDRDVLDDSIKKLEHRQRAQQADVERFQERATYQQKLTYLQAARPFPLYKAAREDWDEAKTRQSASRRQKARLEEQLEPNLRAVNEKAEYVASIQAARDAKKRLVDRTGGITSTKNNQYEAKGRDIDLQKNQHKINIENVKKAHLEVKKTKRSIEKLEEDLRNAPPAVDFAQMNAEIRELTRQLRSHDESKDKANDSLQMLRDQHTHRSSSIREKESRKQHLQSQLGRQASKLAQISKDAAKALTWLQSHKDLFSGPVYEPPLLSCTVKEQRYIPMVEQAIKRNGLLTFTVTNDDDFKLLQRQVYDASNLNLPDVLIRQAPERLSDARPCTNEQLADMGFDGWLIDALEGPKDVLAMLCDNHGIDVLAYSTTTMTGQQHERIKHSPISSWITPKEHFVILRRKEYGDHAVSTRVNQVGPATMFTNAPVNTDAERRLDQEVREMQDECNTINGEITEVKAKLTDIESQCTDLKRKIDNKNMEKSTLQRARAAFDALPTRLEDLRSTLTDEELKVSNFSSVRAQHESVLDRMYLDKAQLSVDLAKSAEQFHNLHMDLLAIELMEIEAKSDHEQLMTRSEEDRRLLEHHKTEVAKLTAVVKDLKEKAMELQQQCQASSDLVDPDDVSAFHDMCNLSIDDLDAQISGTTARLEMNSGGNANVIKEYEARAREIEKKQSQLQKYDDELQQAASEVGEIRSKWEPELQSIVNKISEKFSENFASIQCAGEVELYKNDEDFSQWAIHIKVKFRESEPMSVLNNQRQSGGERAVSTIFYLMAMQSLARAPFRVVDEINQGMDPRNERMVHSRLVSIACDSARDDGSGGSQYFLITPKLLTGLDYHPNMKVHCIASGEYMPKNSALDALDFGRLAKQALAVRAAKA